MNAITTPIFSKPIYEKLIDLDIEKVISMIDTSKRTGTKITANGLHVLDNKKLRFLKDILLKEFYYYAWDTMKYTNNDFEITTSNLWVIIHRAKLVLRDCLKSKWEL